MNDSFEELKDLLRRGAKQEEQKPILRSVPMTPKQIEDWKVLIEEQAAFERDMVAKLGELVERTMKIRHRLRVFWNQAEADLNEFRDLSIDWKKKMIDVHARPFEEPKSKSSSKSRLLALLDE